MKSRLVLTVAAVASIVSFTAPGQAAQSVRYVAGGTAVVKQANQTPAVDNGVVVCNVSTGASADVGGGCVDFAPAVRVNDDLGGNVAFQVCVDNDGDSVCTSPPSGNCGDQIFFSHDDRGNFFNPLGPLPGGFKPGCPGGPWHGYVVFLCNGVHLDAQGGGAHSHPTASGTISTAPSGTGFGNFCGGDEGKPSAKRYVVS